MGILTNFLKLLKPDENDYYNAITEQAENWQKVDNWAKGIDDSNKKKLDKGNVSVEYDTAKKIEDKIKEVKNTADDKLNKSTYQGNAQDLKDEIDSKQDKADNSLKTNDKTVVGGINEIVDNKWRIAQKTLNNGSNLNDILIKGCYVSEYGSDVIANNPFIDITSNTGGIGLMVLPNARLQENRYNMQMVWDRNGNLAYRYRVDAGGTIKYLEYNASPELFWGMLSTTNIEIIQKAGIKEAGKVYWDRDVRPKRPYVCLVTNTDVTPTSKFRRLDLSEICRKVYAMNNKFPNKRTIFTFNGDRKSWKDTTKTELKSANMIQVTVQSSGSTDNKNQTFLLANNGEKVYVQTTDQATFTIFSINFATGLIKRERESSGTTDEALLNNIIREIIIIY